MTSKKVKTIRLIEVQYRNLDQSFYERELSDTFSNIQYYLFVVRSQYPRGNHPDIGFVGIRGGRQSEISPRRFCHWGLLKR